MSETYLSPIADALRAAAPLPEAHAAIVTILEQHTRRGPSGEPEFIDETGAVRLAADRGFQPMTPTEFVADLRRTKPELFAGTATTPKPVAKPETAEAFNLTQQMLAAGKGDKNAMSAIVAHARTR